MLRQWFENIRWLYFQKSSLLLLSLQLCCPTDIHGEVFQILFTWNPQDCINQCPANLEARFSAIPEIAEVQIEAGVGRGELRWKPNTPFSYRPINTTMQMIGLSIHTLRCKVRGIISVEGSGFSLISLGDNTKFQLLGASTLPAHKNDAPVKYSEEVYRLSNEQKTRLLQAAEKFQVVTIEGELFEPERSFLKLIISSLGVGS